MTAFAPQLIPFTTAGLTPAYTAVSAGPDTFANDGRTFLHIKNGGAGASTVTFDSTKSCDQGFDHDLAVSVPAGQERMVGPFPPGRFNNTSGSVAFTAAPTTSVTAAALRLP